MKVRPTQSRERVKGQRSLVPPINTRKKPEKVTNSIARKGVQRVEDPLAGLRGSAPHVPIFSMTFSVMTEVTKPPGFLGIISREC